MSQNLANLALRLLLELAALGGVAVFGWRSGEGPVRLLFAILFPLIAALLWGVFRVPGDASASGGAVVAVPGPIRLVLELSLFAIASAGLYLTGSELLGLTLAALALFHYLLSYDRVLWLLKS